MSFISKIFGRSNDLPVDMTVEILKRHLTSDFIVFPMAENKTTINEIIELEKTIGMVIPLEIKAHLMGQFPGIYIEAKESVWPRGKQYDVAPFWSFLYGVHTFTASDKSADWIRIERVSQNLKDETGISVLPVFKRVGDADIYCVNSEHELILFDHEINEFTPIDGCFFELFDREVGELRERTEKKKLLSNELG